MQAGIVESLDELVKEFVKASNDEKKALFAKIEEEVEKLKGSAARLTQSPFYLMVAHYLNHLLSSKYLVSILFFYFLNVNIGNHFGGSHSVVQRYQFSFLIFICYLHFPFIFRNGKIYLKAVKSSLEKGGDYAKNEIQRLERILEKVIYLIFVSQLLH